MKHEIKQKSTILIFALVLMAFVTHSIHRDNLAVAQFVFVAPVKNPQVFAQAAYDKFKRILTRDDLLPLLPDVLTALKDDKFANPNLSVEIFFTPPLLRQHIPNIDERFITLLDVPEIIEMFTDFEMTRLYGFPAAIDALLDLLAPHLKQVKIVSAFVNAGRYGTLIITGSGMQIGESVAVGTTHTLIFTIINAEGNPVPGLPLNYSINPLDGTAATATFNPATATTNQDGKVYAEITFGPSPGDLRLFAEVDSQRIVEFVELELTQGNTNVNNVTMKGLEHGFARTGTTQTLVFKATDANGIPVSGEELMFGARSEYSSAATATFDPATATTDQNGEARTQITFGAKPGGINLTVQSGPAVEQVNITSSQVHLGSQMEGAFTGLQVGDSVDVGSIHTLVFTATDLRGRPVSGLPIAFTFGGIPLELEAMFDPATATTDRRGQVRTQVTFGEEPGDFQLIVSMDPQRVIVFSEPEFRLGGTNIANLKIQGMEEGFAQPGSSINLVLTATDASGRPVAGEELVFGVGIIPDSQAMVESLQPVKVKTNKKGKAQTRVMFGPEPGEIRLTVKSGVIIHSVLFDVAPYGMMEFKGLQIADGVKVNSTHDLVFTVTNENGKPVPWLPLQLSAVDLDVFAQAATFTPTPRVVTNKNGKARTSITFGDVHGDIRLIATVDRQQIVEFPNPNPKITLNNSKIARLTVKGIEHGFARVGSTRNLLFTAMDKNGNPVKGVKFGFGFRSQLDSNATATFDPATVTTDENGQAETQVTFGQNPGGLRFTIQPPANKITIQSVSSDFNLSMLGDGELTSESFELGDAFKIGSTHNFVFTATKANGDPVPWLPLRFDALYLDGTEAGLTFAPPTVTTNKNGKARMSVTFSGGPGDIRLIAEVDREQIVEFSDPEITLDGSSIAQLTLKGIEQGFSRVGTQRTLVFTATDENGDPVSGVELAFGFRSESDSKATATFDPTAATTDENGKASTRMTLGQNPGELVIEVNGTTESRLHIPDSELRVSLAIELRKYPDTLITEVEMLTLTEFRPGVTSIQDLTGLEFAKNLTTLDLSSNEISDVSPLAGLVSLTSLNLESNGVSDVSPLADLTSLTSLRLQNNEISDVSPLAGLKNLTFLELSYNKISDLSPLAELKNLTTLRLQHSQISDVSPLAGLVNLASVNLSSNEISDVSPLAGLVSLTSLNLGYNEISDVSPLAGLTNLTSLSLQYNRIEDFSWIAGLIPNLNVYHNSPQKIQGVVVDRNPPINIPDRILRYSVERALGKAPDTEITQTDMLTLTSLTVKAAREDFGVLVGNLTGIEFAANLTELNLGSILNLRNISALAGLTNLRKLDLSENYALDISALRGLANLISLNLSGNNISDVSPLAGLVNLTSLNLGSNDISDVSPLAGLTNLTNLDLGYNDISGVSPLAGLTNLTKLNLGANDISDVSPLAGLTNLTNLDLGYNDISGVSPLAGLTNLTKLNLGYNDISDVSPLVGLTNLTFLSLLYNRIEDFSPIAGLIPNLNVYHNSPQEIQAVAVDPNLPINIPDRNLRYSIERTLGKAPGTEITQVDMLTLTSLTVTASRAVARVADLTGIELAVNLTELNLDTILNVENISVLGGLTNLTELNLGGSQTIVDISALGGLTNLEKLDLRANQIIDVSTLGGLTNLMELNLRANRISDIASLSSLRNLEKLDIGDNHISDISAFRSLTNLMELNLAGNRILDISSLSSLRNLEKLDLTGNRISDISAFRSLTNLMELHLGLNNISDVSPLVGLTNLTYLNLYSNQIWDFSPIEDILNNLALLNQSFPEIGDQREQGVNIYNVTLRSAIRVALGKATGAPITHADMQTLTVLEAPEKTIDDLTGIEFATNLEVLDLGKNWIFDLSALAGLTNLRELNLEHNDIIDVSALGGLTNLRELNLRDNDIIDVSALGGLTNLEKLDLTSNRISRISDISAFRGLTNLRELNLEHNDIIDVSALGGLMNLEKLDLEDSHISDISAFRGLTNLRELNLRGNQTIVDISALGGLRNLEKLDLTDNRILDISAFRSLTNLMELHLGLNNISDVSPLVGLTNLTYLNLYSNQIWDFSPIEDILNNLALLNQSFPEIGDQREQGVNIYNVTLRSAIRVALGKAIGAPITHADMQTLTVLEAPEKTIDDLTGIEFATNLEVLDLGKNWIFDLSALAGLTNLRELNLEHNDIIDVSALGGLTNLEKLWLSHNEISDVSSLSALRNLVDVDLAYNKIMDVSALGGLTDLERLLLLSNAITDISSLSVLTNLESLGLSSNAITDISSLSVLTNLERLWLGGNAITDISSLSGLRSLMELDLGYNKIIDVSALGGLTNLEKLWLHNNEISDVSALAGLTNLTVLDLRDNEISDASPLAGLINLVEKIEIHGNPLDDTDIPLSLSGEFLKNVPEDPDTLVNVPDSTLHKVLTWELRKTVTDPITRADMAKFTAISIDRHPSKIQNLAGLEFAINLESLSLSEHHISDVSPLAGLTQLESLSLDHNVIFNLSPLAGLTNLNTLSLDHNVIFNLSALAGLTNLNTLSLDYNVIFNLSALAGLTNLNTLSLDHNEISDVSPLAGMTQLEELNLSRNYISDFTPLEGLYYNGKEQRLVVISHKSFSGKGVGVTEIIHANPVSHYRTETTHKIEWLFRKDRYPIEGLPLVFTATSYGSISSASASFSPSTVTTDSFGRATTYISFGENGGGIKIHITMEYVVTQKTRNQSGATVYKHSDGNETVLIKGLDLNAPATAIISAGSDYKAYKFTGSLTTSYPPKVGKHFNIYTQKGSTCGQYSALMLLYYYGVKIDKPVFDDVADIFHSLWGTTPAEMMQGLELLPVDVDHFVGTADGYSPYESLKDKVSESRPPIIVIRLSEIGYHHVIVVGYDTKSEMFLIADPNGAFMWVNFWKWTNTGFFSDAGREVWRPPLNDSWALEYQEEDIENFFDVWLVPDMQWVSEVDWAIGDTFKPYRMFVPKKAPPYHHLESETHEIYETGDEIANVFNREWHDWKREITVGGKVVAYSYVHERRDADIRDVKVEDNKVIISGRIANGLPLDANIVVVDNLFFGAIDIVLTVYYDPSVSAAPSITLPASPMETALLHNYPNPFNPETWIPYHLSEPADVTLTIYAMDGQVVRRLDLGHQVSGFYHSKGRAAYWDGRNAVGERVASGIYFYTITAGDFAATRKMLIRK